MSMSKFMAERYEAILAKQKMDWPKHLEGSRKYGNPFATLCDHCYGRHEPPRNEICPSVRAKAKP